LRFSEGDFLKFVDKNGYFIERIKRWYMYMKYMRANAVKPISNDSIAGLFSIAVK